MIRYIQQAWLVLLLGLVFGLSLAAVNSELAPMIEANEAEARRRAAVAVFDKAATGAETAEQVQIEFPGVTVNVYRVLDKAGRQVGWAAPAQGQGYADTIKLIVGLTADAGRITGIKVIYNQETPGLGNKIVGDRFCNHFRGKSANVKLTAAKKTADFAAGEIEAITGATISSQAVCDIIYAGIAESGLAGRLAEAFSREVQTEDAD